ncbi:MAG: hypothetical protein C4309_14160, partial [Chloroflexota bacterium]
PAIAQGAATQFHRVDQRRAEPEPGSVSFLEKGIMNTHDLMALALDMAGMQEMPLDSAIYVSGEDIRRVLIGIDIGAGERALSMAKTLGHHP